MILSQVVNRINGNVDRFSTNLLYYIGGEHFESNELEITKKGIIKDNLGVLGFKFHFAFQDRDVIFMARNPHLQKAGMVHFSGLCSDASYILRSKDENVLSQEYLAILLQSDQFWNYCESHKVGSVNFANNWTSIANYEFDLPPIERQREIAAKVWAAYEVKESYKNLLAQTDKLLHAQFEKMFGDVENTIYDLKDIKSFADCYAGATPSTRVVDYWENGNIPWMSSGEVHQGRVIRTEQYITQKGYDNCSTKMVPKHSIVIALAGQGKTRGTVAVTEIDLCTNQSLCAIIPNSTVLPDYLYYHLKGRYMEIRRLAANADGRGGLNLAIINKIKVIVPPMEKQLEFVSIAEQAEQTKASLNKGIEAIEAVIRSLIAEGTTRV